MSARNNKRSRRARGRRNGGNGFNRIPRLTSGVIDTPATHTFAAPLSIIGSSASTALNWGTLDGFSTLASFYHYFEPLSYKIDFPQPLAAAATAVPALVFAFLPINWIVEGVTTVTPDPGILTEMRGNVVVYQGAKTSGSWCKWPPLTQ
jgi:hypothetical protein